ncbi:GDP-mannose 4,6-dehydratase [Candidatus Parcubacteria bacterium]|nr:MAG: GDP-mannose 4,6-dehydratase [Candidatus Parcubacteria bacterium]
MVEKKALIIGISGQDGSYLSKFLLNKGYTVIGTSRDAMMSSFSNLKKLDIFDKVQVESVSLNDFRSVLQVLKKHSPNEIYNLAGQSSVGLSFEQPVETFESVSVAVLNLLEAMRFLEIPARLYNAGSSECFGNTNGEPASETTPFRPRSPYAVAKSAAFWQVANYREAYKMYACSGILFNHESPLRPDRFVSSKIVKSACRIYLGSSEKLSLGNISVQRDWGWAPEFVEAMWRMLQQDEPDDYVVATGETNSLKDFIEKVFGVLNLNWHEHVQHNANLIRPADIQVSIANTNKVEKKLGWKARHRMTDVIKMMVEAELEQSRQKPVYYNIAKQP